MATMRNAGPTAPAPLQSHAELFESTIADVVVDSRQAPSKEQLFGCLRFDYENLLHEVVKGSTLSFTVM
jgi:hypothetical protein